MYRRGVKEVMMAGARVFSMILLATIFSAGWSGMAGADMINKGRCYDTTGREIGCAGTGQDGEIQAGTAWPAPRFMDNGDGTVTDKLTGLTWLKDAGCLGRADHAGAREKVTAFNSRASASGCAEYHAPYHDWRLPQVRELESLINLAAPEQAAWLAAAGFVNVEASGYWSATPAAGAYKAWLVELAAGAVDDAPKTSAQSIWPVRGAPNQKTESTSQRSPRFVAHSDTTVTDRETGLIWLRDAGGHAGLTWSEALALAGHPDAGQKGGTGAAGWRLPNRRELQSLLDYRRDDPALPPDAPFTGLRASFYWTSSTVAASPDRAWAVQPLSGDTRPLGKTEKAAAWLVRSAATMASRLAQTADWREVKPEETRPEEANNATPPRFIRHPDGTVTDNLTGLMWMANGHCLGMRSWSGAREAVARLDSDENPFTCEGYSASYRDWRLPDLKQMQKLEPPAGTADPVAWLEKQGFRDIQPQGYWTENDSRSDIYYGWLFNLQVGATREYPKNFKFFVLPCRRAKEGERAKIGGLAKSRHPGVGRGPVLEGTGFRPSPE